MSNEKDRITQDWIRHRLTSAGRQYRHNDDNSPSMLSPKQGFAAGYDWELTQKLVADLAERERELCAQVERLQEAVTDEAIDLIRCGIGSNYGDGLREKAIERVIRPIRQALNETPAQSLRELRAEAIEQVAVTLMPSMPSQPDDPPEGFNDYCEALAEVKRFAQQIRSGKR